MKRIAIMLLLAYATTASARTITVSRTATDNSGDYLHQIANVFVDSVGNALKKEFPSAIVSGSMSVTLTRSQNGLTLSYSCEIETVSPDEAQYYFEHAGALSVSRTASAARSDASNRANRQFDERVTKFRVAYGEQITCYLENKSSCNDPNFVWAIHENFIAAAKN